MRALFYSTAFLLFLVSTACSFSRKEFAVEPSVLGYFLESYTESRQAFRDAAAVIKAKKPGAVVEAIKVPTKEKNDDDDLTIDSLYLPAEDKKQNLIIVVSGVHGLEGFAGSAMQRLFMKEFLPSIQPGTGVLLLHAVNPWGFKNFRRVTENNVDLNRNSSVTSGLYENENKGYRELNEFLNPKEPADTASLGNTFFFLRAVWRIVADGMATLRQAILQGQYEFPQGLYFGGQKQEPQITALGPFLKKKIAPYKKIYEINFHTGYGEQGKLHFFPNPIEDPAKRKRVEAIYEGYTIDWGDSDDFYTTTGEFSGFLEQLAPKKDFVNMVFEYGTLDSQTTSGSVRSIENMILENQGWFYGYDDEEDRQEVRERVLDMFYPSDKAWRSEIARQTRQTLRTILPRMQ